MKQEQIDQLRRISRKIDEGGIRTTGDLFVVVPRLQSISRSLSRLAEGNCNGDWSHAEDGQKPSRQERRELRLANEALGLAESIGATVYFQGDPRGAALYLIFPGDIPDGSGVDSCYTNGVAIY